nr:hypothetical protein KXZ65_03635 [Pectobacterium sp. PL152]
MVAEPSTTIRFLLASRQCELNSLRYLLQSGELVGKISQLVHLLQRERGTANLFLCSDGRFSLTNWRYVRKTCRRHRRT